MKDINSLEEIYIQLPVVNKKRDSDLTSGGNIISTVSNLISNNSDLISNVGKVASTVGFPKNNNLGRLFYGDGNSANADVTCAPGIDLARPNGA